jgi:hypothetical protein
VIIFKTVQHRTVADYEGHKITKFEVHHDA